MLENTVQDDHCPKCGTETEEIAVGTGGPPIEHVQLCPNCYLVTWSDNNGLHFQQGVPIKKGETREETKAETEDS